MKKLTLLCWLLSASILTVYAGEIATDEKGKYTINANGDVCFCRELSTALSFPEVCAKVTEVIAGNFVNAGAGVSLDNGENLFLANYIFPAVQRDFPLVLDAWCVLKVELKNRRIHLSLTLTNYSKRTSKTQEYIRISDVQPLNPNGQKHGFRSQKKLVEAFDNTIKKTEILFTKLLQTVENKS